MALSTLSLARILRFIFVITSPFLGGGGHHSTLRVEEWTYSGNLVTCIPNVNGNWLIPGVFPKGPLMALESLVHMFDCRHNA